MKRIKFLLSLLLALTVLSGGYAQSKRKKKGKKAKTEAPAPKKTPLYCDGK